MEGLWRPFGHLPSCFRAVAHRGHGTATVHDQRRWRKDGPKSRRSRDLVETIQEAQSSAIDIQTQPSCSGGCGLRVARLDERAGKVGGDKQRLLRDEF